MGFLTAAVVSAAVGALPAERAGLASGVNNTARQAVGALGVAIYGWVAGRPAGFIRGLHVLGLLGAALWVVALVITWLTIGPVRQASGSFGPDGAEDGRA